MVNDDDDASMCLGNDVPPTTASSSFSSSRPQNNALDHPGGGVTCGGETTFSGVKRMAVAAVVIDPSVDEMGAGQCDERNNRRKTRKTENSWEMGNNSVSVGHEMQQQQQQVGQGLPHHRGGYGCGFGHGGMGGGVGVGVTATCIPHNTGGSTSAVLSIFPTVTTQPHLPLVHDSTRGSGLGAGLGLGPGLGAGLGPGMAAVAYNNHFKPLGSVLHTPSFHTKYTNMPTCQHYIHTYIHAYMHSCVHKAKYTCISNPSISSFCRVS